MFQNRIVNSFFVHIRAYTSGVVTGDNATLGSDVDVATFSSYCCVAIIGLLSVYDSVLTVTPLDTFSYN